MINILPTPDSITIDFSERLQGPDVALHAILIRKLFAGDRRVRRVSVQELEGSHAGLSSVALMVAYPFGANDEELNPMLVRIGRHELISHELENFQRYIGDLTGPYVVAPSRNANEQHLAAIGYPYMTERRKGLRTLRDFLWRTPNYQEAQACIQTLFDALTQVDRHNGWYNDAQRYENQRPLWFYNHVLPPTLVLEDVAQTTDASSYLALADALAQADRPGARDLCHKWVVLAVDDVYRHIRVVERQVDGDAGRLRICVYEGAVPERHAFYRPPAPVAARIELRLSPQAAAALPDTLDATKLCGRVCQTRYAMLEDRVRQLKTLHTRYPDGITYNEIRWGNPLQVYADLLIQKRPIHASIIHGDMNLGNILLSQAGTQADPSAIPWLIDFDRTGPGGHTVFDAVKLETEYKIHILPHQLDSIDQLVTLERALHQSLVCPEQEFNIQLQGTLLDAFNFIVALRRLALGSPHLHTPIPPAEYFLGLLGYGLAALKYRNLYTDYQQRWLAPNPDISPLATAAYLSAASAGFALKLYSDITALKSGSYQALAPETPPIADPRPFSREQLLRQARSQMLAPGAVVVIYGIPGSGHDAVAESLCAALQRSGQYVWPSPKPLCAVDLESLVARLDELFHQQDLPAVAPLLNPRTGRLASIDQQGVQRKVQERILENLRHLSPTITLWIDIYKAEPAVRSLIINLAQAMRHTRLVLVADQQLLKLPARAMIEVPPFTLTELEAYLQAQQVLLDKAAILCLHQLSSGLPELVATMIEDTTATGQEPHHVLKAAIDNQCPSTNTNALAERLFAQLPEPQQRMLELAALLHHYSPQRLGDLPWIAEALARSGRWLPADLALHTIWDRTRGWVHGAATPVLYQPAFHSQQARPDAHAICALIADYYAKHTEQATAHLVARYYACAGQWSSAAETLQAIADETLLARFGQHAETLYTTAIETLPHVTRQKRSLRELAGDCAAYLGRYSAAAEQYEHLIALLTPSDPNWPTLLVRAIKVQEACGNQQRVRRLVQELRRSSKPTDPCYALASAYEGVLLLERDNKATRTTLTEAITLLQHILDEQPNNADLPFYRTELVRLQDYLARSESLQGEHDLAITRANEAYRIAETQIADEYLSAMIESNLGVMHFNRGGPTDIDRARILLKSAYERRMRIGDQVGMIRTGMNLNIFAVERAPTLEALRPLDACYQQIAQAAQRVEADDRHLITANHMEVLIRMGELRRAQELFDAAMNDTRIDHGVQTVLWRNRAKLALWAADPATCLHYLALVQQAVELSKDTADMCEWLQLTAECTLLFNTPFDISFITHVLSQAPDDDRSMSEMIEWIFVRGLLAGVQGDSAIAFALLERSHTHWEEYQYNYLAAIVALRAAQIGMRLMLWDKAHQYVGMASKALAPFGGTPAFQQLAALQLLLPEHE